MICGGSLSNSGHNSRGFTLIEVMVSLTILALITGVAVAGLGIGIDSWHRGSRTIEELDRRFAVERFIERQLAQAESKSFEGNHEALTFISAYSLASGLGDPTVVKYSFESGKLLYFETVAAGYDPQHPELGRAQNLGVFSRMVFRYLGKDAFDKPIWLDEWKNENGDIPAVVQVQIGADVFAVPMMNRR